MTSSPIYPPPLFSETVSAGRAPADRSASALPGTPDPDWVNGPVAALRAWRDARPEVLRPVLPPDVVQSVLLPEGGCPGGLIFGPLAMAGGSGGDISRQKTTSEAVPVVYFHGGGFIVGSPETHRVVTAWIAQETGAEVISIRYRLAPDHPFPAQAEDAVAAVRRQLIHHGRLRIMGDSAGGLVALWAFAGLAVAERTQIESLTLFYPGAGPGMEPAPANAQHEADGLGPESLASYHRHLDPDGLIAGDPRFDPLAAGFAALAGPSYDPAAGQSDDVAPCRLTILAAGMDPILRDSEALARALRAKLITAADKDHGFLGTLPAASVLGHLRAALYPG